MFSTKQINIIYRYMAITHELDRKENKKERENEISIKKGKEEHGKKISIGDRVYLYEI